MADRTATPDILGAVISGEAIKEESNKAIKQAISKTIKTSSNKAIKPPNNKAVPRQMLIDGTEETIAEPQEEPKEKATFNLPIKLLRELEDKWMEMRRLSGSKQVSKTLIVEEALKMAFAEFDLKKETGKFYSKLVSNKEIKK